MDKAMHKVQDTAKEAELQMIKSKEALTKLASEQINFNQAKPSLTHLDVPKAPTFHNASFQPGIVKAQLAVQIKELLYPNDQLIHVSILYRNNLDGGIRVVTAVDGNHALVTVYNNYKQLRLDDTDGKVMKCINTKFSIAHVAVTTSGDIITTDFHGRYIRIMSQTGQVTKTINAKPNYLSGVCLGNDNQEMVVCVYTPCNLGSKLVVYNRDGKKMRSIKYTGKPVGRNIGQRVIQNSRGDYCVAHPDQRKVYVVDSNVEPRYTYDGSGARKMKGNFLASDICSDSYNHLFISDFNNHNIHMLGDDGKFLRFILEQDGITKPTGLCIEKNGRLWIGERDGGLCIGIVKYFK